MGLAERYPMIVVAQTVDKLKDAGFHWATRSGVTVSMADVLVPPRKKEILDSYEGFLQVRTPAGLTGWIPRHTITGSPISSS